MRRLRSIFLIAILSLLGASWAAFGAATETPMPAAHDVVQHATEAEKKRMPLILLVSLRGCPYCEEVRKLHLAPLEKTGVMVHQIYLDRDTPLAGFDGQPTTQRALAKKLAVRVAPTVLFLNARGEQIAEPIVGALHEDFYGEYLTDAIAASKKRLGAAR